MFNGLYVWSDLMFDVRYIKLTFELEIISDCMLPMNKASALRGGMGNMLLEFNCTHDEEKCEECDLNSECIVQRIMNPESQIQLSTVPNGAKNSTFIIECFDNRTTFYEGDILRFNLIVFASATEYLLHLIHAFIALGDKGLGSDRSQYNIRNVTNEYKESVFKDGYVYKENIKIHTIREYIDRRKTGLQGIEEINFITPLRLLKRGKLVSSIYFEDIISALSRRLQILNALQGVNVGSVMLNSLGEVLSSDLNWVDINRYSSTQKRKVTMGGVKGKIRFSSEINEYIDYLIAGELVHVGKNVTFGYGKYIIAN